MARITDDQRAHVLRLHKTGTTRNDIAREVGISAGSVTNICKTAGVTFDRSATQSATYARAADLAEARMNLAWRLDEAANAALDMLGKPFKVFNFGGKDNTFNSHVLDSPPVEAQRTIITSAAIAFDKITRIVERDSGGLETAVGVLDSLAGTLTAAAEMLRADGDTPDGE